MLGNFEMFESVAALLSSATSGRLIRNLVAEHLSSLVAELKEYLPDLSEADLKLARNPFKLDVAEVPNNMQDQIIDLINDSGARDVFEDAEPSKFWCSNESHPILNCQSLLLKLY